MPAPHAASIGILGHRFESRLSTFQLTAQIANDDRSISRAMCDGRSAAQIANDAARLPPDKMCPRAVGWRQHKKVSANPVAVQHFGAVQHLEGGGWGRRGA